MKMHLSAMLSGTLLVCIASIASANSGNCVEQLDPNVSKPNDLIACLVQMQAKIDTLEAAQNVDFPTGAVVASVVECSEWGETWTPYYPAAGRFVVGAGPHHPEDQNIKNRDNSNEDLTEYLGPDTLTLEILRTPSRANGTRGSRVGGTEKHTLTPQEMPAHSHTYNDQIVGDIRNAPAVGSAYLAPGTYAGRYWRNWDNGNYDIASGVSGSGEAHNNMPPFIALFYCKKEG